MQFRMTLDVFDSRVLLCTSWPLGVCTIEHFNRCLILLQPVDRKLLFHAYKSVTASDYSVLLAFATRDLHN